MSDWIKKLDEFLHLSDQEVLQLAGEISHESAVNIAHREYDKFKKRLNSEELPVVKHFENAIKCVGNNDPIK